MYISTGIGIEVITVGGIAIVAASRDNRPKWELGNCWRLEMHELNALDESIISPC